MAQQDRQGAQRHGNIIIIRQQARKPNRQKALADIEKQNNYSRLAAGRAMHIGSSDISAPHRANVFAGGEPHKPVSERQAADQIR